MSDHQREGADRRERPTGSARGASRGEARIIGQPSEAPHVRSWREGAWRYWSQGRGGGTVEDHLGDFPGGSWRVPPPGPASATDGTDAEDVVAARDGASEVRVPEVPAAEGGSTGGADASLGGEGDSGLGDGRDVQAADDVADVEAAVDGERTLELGSAPVAGRDETLARRIERLEGRDVPQAIARPGTRDEAVWVARVLENALMELHDIHERGQVHGAISPQRVMITESERAVLLDPQLATTEPDGAYAAPETLVAEPGDAPQRHSDVWSVGACLFEALTWERPYVDARAAAVAALRGDPVPAPRALNPAVPRALSEVVQRAIDPNPEVRYGSAADFAADLRAARTGARPSAVMPLRRRSASSRLTATLSVALVLLAVSVVLALVTLYEERQERAALSRDLKDVRDHLASAHRSLDVEISCRRGVTTRYSPDGSRLVALFDNGASASLCATPDGIPEGFTRLVGHERPINGAAFDREGGRLLTASADGTAALWNVATGTRTLQFVGHEDQVMTAEWSAKGGRVVTGSLDGTARVWDAETGVELHVLKNPAPVRMARFSPSGRHVLTLTSTGTVLIFDLASGEVLATIDGPPPPLL